MEKAAKRGGFFFSIVALDVSVRATTAEAAAGSECPAAKAGSSPLSVSFVYR
jgi:hypothetical protein